jgi:antitoxin HicB
MLNYPARLTPDTNGTILVTFPDVPAAATFGDSEDDALARAADALETALMMYIEDRQPIPKPSSSGQAGVRGKKWSVRLSALSEAKVALYEAMREAGVRKAELARRLNLHMPQIDRLLNLGHASRLDQIETALRALGKELVIEIRAA